MTPTNPFTPEAIATHAEACAAAAAEQGAVRGEAQWSFPLDHEDAEQRLGRDLTREESAAWERAFWLALPE